VWKQEKAKGDSGPLIGGGEGLQDRMTDLSSTPVFEPIFASDHRLALQCMSQLD
jgi:hypothetical protein